MIKFLIQSIISTMLRTLGGCGRLVVSNRCHAPITRAMSSRVIDQDPKESIFAKVIKGEIPVDKVYENESCVAFKDIDPQAPIHILIIPKEPIGGISAMEEKNARQVGELFLAGRKIAEDLNIHEKGYRLVINDGSDGQQTVRWLHVHLLGGRQMSWPPG